MGFTLINLALILAPESKHASFLARMTCSLRAVCILRSKGRSMEDLKDFEQYMAHLSEGLGHSDRHAGLRGYTTGLMSPLQRKSVEPMAAHMDPLNVRSRHQSLHHFVADAN